MKTCKNCGKELTLDMFKGRVFMLERAICCNIKCLRAWEVKHKEEQMTDFYCIICGKFIVRRLAYHPILTCSWECKGKAKGLHRKAKVKDAGYYKIFTNTEHSNKYGYEWEHRYVMRLKLGRALKTCEQVHHINGNKLDNREENLIIMTAQEHGHHHNPPHITVAKPLLAQDLL